MTDKNLLEALELTQQILNKHQEKMNLLFQAIELLKLRQDVFEKKLNMGKK